MHRTLFLNMISSTNVFYFNQHPVLPFPVKIQPLAPLGHLVHATPARLQNQVEIRVRHCIREFIRDSMCEPHARRHSVHVHVHVRCGRRNGGVECTMIVIIIGRRGALTSSSGARSGPICLPRTCSRPRLHRGSAPAPPGACSPALSQLLYS